MPLDAMVFSMIHRANGHEIRVLEPMEYPFLPSYSPELNPAEDLWKLIREKCTHNTYYEHFKDKIAVVREFLVKCKNPSAEVRSRCHYK
jgi:transposase